MELDGSASPTWNPFEPFSVSREPSAPRPTFHLPLPSEMPAAPPRRFPGDGYDYRMPVVSSDNVIDLTDEDAGPSSASREPPQPPRPRGRPRPPRFGREIIDIEDEESEVAEPPDSPEIQFLSSQPAQQRNRTPFNVEDEDDDEVQFVSENPLPPLPPSQGRMAIFEDPAYRARASRLRDIRERLLERREAEQRRSGRDDAQFRRMERLFALSRARTTPRPLTSRPRPVLQVGGREVGIHIGFVAPDLNFGAVGFNLGFEDEPEAVPPPAPTYNAPAAAPEGFTRSPQEKDVLVCPNCDDELCIGGSDQKRQVWLVKACGHVCTVSSIP